MRQCVASAAFTLRRRTLTVNTPTASALLARPSTVAPLLATTVTRAFHASAAVTADEAATGQSEASPQEDKRVHLVKLIARAGVASRRDALSLVQSGRVLVDGAPLTAPGASYLIAPTSRVTIDGKPFLDPAGAAALAAKGKSTTVSSIMGAGEDSAEGKALRVPTHLPRPRVWLYYKPVGLIVSHKDDAAARAGPSHARRTIFEQLQEDYFAEQDAKAALASGGEQPATVDRLLSVGRLDYLSEGLMVLTNSGALQRFLEHPSSAFSRSYRIKVDGVLTRAQEEELRAGADVDGFRFKPCQITRLTNADAASIEQGAVDVGARAAWYEVTLQEGKNRELRALLNHCGRSILKLVRVSFHQWGLDMAHMASFATAEHDRMPLSQRSVRVSSQPAERGQPKRSLYGLVPGQLVEIDWPAALEQRRRQWNAEQQVRRAQQQHDPRTPMPSAAQRSLRSGAPGLDASARVASISMLAAGSSGALPLGARLFSTSAFAMDSPASAFLTRQKGDSRGAPSSSAPARGAAAHGVPASKIPSHIHSATCGCPSHGAHTTANSDAAAEEQGSEAFLAELNRAVKAEKAVAESLVAEEQAAVAAGSAASAAHNDDHFAPAGTGSSGDKWTLAHMLKHNFNFVQKKEFKPFLTDRYPFKKLVVVSCMDTRLVELLPAALDLRNGDAKIIKVAGAMVAHPFGSVMRSILVAVYALGAEHILVVGHHDCGMTGMNPSKVLEQARQRGVPESTFKTLRSAGLNLDAWLSGFQSVQSSVLHSVETIRNHPLLSFHDATLPAAKVSQLHAEVAGTAGQQQGADAAATAAGLPSVARARLPRISVSGLVICPTTGRLDLLTETDAETQALVDRQNALLDQQQQGEPEPKQPGGNCANTAAVNCV